MEEIRTKPITRHEVWKLKGKRIKLSRSAFIHSHPKAREELDLVPVYLRDLPQENRPNAMGRPKTYTREEVSAMLRDAEVMGVAEAAKKHGFPLRTAYWYHKKEASE